MPKPKAKTVKLSPAQQRLLDEIREKGEVSCVTQYAPAQKLLILKLVKITHTSQFGRITLKENK